MTIDQPVTTYSDSAAVQKVISDFIFNIDPVDTPVVAKLGLSSAGSKFRLTAATRSPYNTKIELLEDTYQPLTTTANNNTTITTSTLTFTVTDASLFNPGDQILVDSEYMVVSARDTATNIITVDSRAYGGTNATHATGATITFVGKARVEAASTSYVGLTSLSNVYNYTSIFQKGVQVSGSEDQLAQYGKPSGEFEYQVNKVIPELSRDLERAFFNSIRRIGTASQSRAMGSVFTYVAAASGGASISTTLTKAALDALAKTIFDNGGAPDLIVQGSAATGTLHTLMDTSSFVRITQENTMFGMRPVTMVNTQFFENLQLLTSRHAPVKKSLMLDSSKVGFYTYRPFAQYPVARTADARQAEVIGEFSLLVANGSLGHGTIATSNSTL
jgi:hypothetical protein